MGESLFSLLLYVFENYPQLDEIDDNKHQEITDEMLKAGFEKTDVERVLNWFRHLNHQRELLSNSSLKHQVSSHRVFARRERDCLTPEARSRLLELQQKGYIDTVTRELVLDRLIALDEPMLDASEIDWLVLVIMFQDNSQPYQMRLMEDMVLQGEPSISH